MPESQSEEITVQAAGVPVHVRRSGCGPNVLFIHGVWVNGTVWDDVVTELADTVTCWVPTLPIGGHAEPLPESWAPTLDLIASTVPDLIGALDLSDVTVVGNDSGGGFVLLALGSGRPELRRIKRVVLTNCDSYDHFPPPGFLPLIQMAAADPTAARAQLEPMLFTDAGRAQFVAAVCASSLSRDRTNVWFGPPAVLDDVVKATGALTTTPGQQEMAWLSTVRTPVDLVWGDADSFFPMSDCDRLAAALPVTTVTTIPAAKTYVQVDAPNELAGVIRTAATG